jgi:hypothetical protein
MYAQKSPHLSGSKNSPRLAERLKDSEKPHHDRNMSWAQRIKRVFNIEFTQCEVCEKYNVTIIASITDAIIVNKSLSYLDKHDLPEASNNSRTPPRLAPPSIDAFSDYTIQRDFDFGT